MKIITGRAGSRPACGRGAGPAALRSSVRWWRTRWAGSWRGIIPKTNGPLIQNAGAKSHQPGWDLTFSAPKSVSALWSQADPGSRQTIQDAHFSSVKEGLSYLEETAAITRRGKGGNRKEEAHLAVATFEHGTSRAQDPQLHTHCLVMNACLRDDGTSGTIESKPLYRAMTTGGAIYRAELAAQLERLLRLGVERRGSCFELEGVPQPLIAHFSKRRAAIERALQEKGYDGPAAAAMATLTTRPAKEPVARAALFRDWQEAGRGLGWGPEEARELLRNAPSPERERHTDKTAMLQKASERGAERRGYFTERELVRFLAEEAPGRGLGASVVRAVAAEHLAQSPEIVSLGQRNGEPLYTTPEMAETERRLFAGVERSKDQRSCGVTEATLVGVIATRRTGNEEQAAALRHLCGDSEGSIRVISGREGADKIRLLAAARLSWELEGFQVFGAALSGKAVKELTTGAGIPSDTLERTLRNLEAGKMVPGGRSVLVVDEAERVGVREMQRLVEATTSSGARLALIGDIKRSSPFERGGPLIEMARRLEENNPVENERQRAEWARGAFPALWARPVREGLAAYAERGLLRVAEDRTAAYDQLISDWKAEGVRAPQEHLILAGSRVEAALLNRMAQEERENAGALGRERVAAPRGVGAFHVGDRILFTRTSRLYEVESGSFGEAVAADARTGTLAVRLDSGERVTIPLAAFPYVQLGYAMTTCRGRGTTVQDVFALVRSAAQDPESNSVSLLKMRGAVHLFTDRETAGETLYRLTRQITESRPSEFAPAPVQERQEREATIRREPQRPHF